MFFIFKKKLARTLLLNYLQEFFLNSEIKLYFISSKVLRNFLETCISMCFISKSLEDKKIKKALTVSFKKIK